VETCKEILLLVAGEEVLLFLGSLRVRSIPEWTGMVKRCDVAQFRLGLEDDGSGRR